ncbi:RTC4-like domain-containing protein [Xylaria arbuscula]|nr:RTC4-like domain-containing protein [Xylaria arbuscula]
MTGSRSSVRPQQPRIGLSKYHSTGSPLTQFRGKGNGKNIRPAKRQKVDQPDKAKGDMGPSDKDLGALPESSDDEAENVSLQQTGASDSDDSDEEYNRRNAADIRGTIFNSETPKSRVQLAHRQQPHESRRESGPSLAKVQKGAEVKDLKEFDELDALREKKKRPFKMATYGDQSKRKGSSSSRDGFSTPKHIQPDDAQSPKRKSFQRALSISPMKSQSPRKPFKTQRQISDLDELGDSEPIFNDLSRRNRSPFARPRKRNMDPLDETVEDKDGKAVNPISSRLQRKRSKRNNPLLDPAPEEASQRPIFKMPGLDDDDFFDDSSSLGATTVPGESQDTSWDHLETEETEGTTTPRCPMCHQEVDRELLEKYSTQGKMSVKQQTTFCRSHKRKSAAKLGAEKGYPNIDWETLDRRLNSHRKFLQEILEGTQASHYRDILKERVDSGKNRTLLKSHDNLTPGYYGPKGLQVMTQFIMRTLSDVVRRRAVEDKLISARSYTGYVQTVLVPELTVRLIMEDMSIGEDKARDVLEESVEIGELLHEEDRDVVMINEWEGNMAPEI